MIQGSGMKRFILIYFTKLAFKCNSMRTQYCIQLSLQNTQNLFDDDVHLLNFVKLCFFVMFLCFSRLIMV